MMMTVMQEEDTIQLPKRLEWQGYFEPDDIRDERVAKYIYELQCFVLECSAVAERHKTIRLEQMAKVCCS